MVLTNLQLFCISRSASSNLCGRQWKSITCGTSRRSKAVTPPFFPMLTDAPSDPMPTSFSFHWLIPTSENAPLTVSKSPIIDQQSR